MRVSWNLFFFFFLFYLLKKSCRLTICFSSTILGISVLSDRLFYGIWTFPPINFIYFNIAQSLSSFYGINNWHYYITQGFPLLLTTALPFAVVGLYRALTTSTTTTNTSRENPHPHKAIEATLIQKQLAIICIVMPLCLSFVAHKEVRFMYPLLPCLHVLAASPLVDFFMPAFMHFFGGKGSSSSSSLPYKPRLRLVILLSLLLANVIVAFYTTIYHESGPLNVLSYLRGQHEARTATTTTTTIGFLMPCHSTPWRSHLIYPNIHAWALTCEPPLNQNETEKASYLDEADLFYANVSNFLQRNMLGGLKTPIQFNSQLSSNYYSDSNENEDHLHYWPDYLVFFAQLEPTLRDILNGNGHSSSSSISYTECWRTWNTAWHHDWRRRGDILVWCPDHEP